MALSAQAVADLQKALVDLTRAVQAQTQQAQQAQGGGGGSTAGAAAAAPAVGGAGGSFGGGGSGGTGAPRGGAKDETLAGLGMSLNSSFAHVTGPTGAAISNIASGFAGGGALGGAGAMIGEGLGAARALGHAGQEGRLGAPLFSGAGRQEADANFRKSQQGFSVIGSIDDAYEGLGMDRPAQSLLKDLFGYDTTKQQRASREEKASKDFVSDYVTHALEKTYSSYVRAGGEVTAAQLDNAAQYQRDRALRLLSLEQHSREHGDHMAGYTPSAQEQHR